MEKKMEDPSIKESDFQTLRKAKASLMKKGIAIAKSGLDVFLREISPLLHQEGGSAMEEKMSSFAKKVGENFFYPGLFLGVEDAKEKLSDYSWLIVKYWKEFEKGMASSAEKAVSMKEGNN